MSGSPLKFELRGRRALVSGAASGIGLATATLLARCGARVAINDLPTSPRLESEVERLRGERLEVFAVPGNVGSKAGAEAIVATALGELGGLDYLVNNAATPNTRKPIPASDLEALTEAFWERILSVNLLSVFWMSKAAAPALREARGSVVNTVSISAFGGGGSSAAYSTGKAGLVGLTRELARGLAPEIRVNGIAPGMVNSNWECDFGDKEAAAREKVPLARVGEPEDYAEAIVYLAAAAGYVTGEVLTVSGGYRI